MRATTALTKQIRIYRLQKQTGKSQEKARKQVKTKPRISQSKQIKRKQGKQEIQAQASQSNSNNSSASKQKQDFFFFFFFFKRKPSKIFISFSGASKQSNISSAN
jgi:hypothetical protein